VNFAKLNAHIPDVPTALPPRGEGVPPLYPPEPLPFELTVDGLDAWFKSSYFQPVLELAQANRVDSLLSDESRALLYHLILTIRPERVLEIGTFRAGTSRFLAQALHHAGRGVLYTVDPFGLENRVPEIIHAWPAHLQHHVRFYSIDSACFFGYAINRALPFDLVFIDGDHELEFASFDLNSTARLIKPGGIVVLDNIDQPGPRYATKVYLDANPDWKEIGHAVGMIDTGNPLGDLDGSFPETKFFVLQAPNHFTVSCIPRSFGSILSDTPKITAIEMLRPAGR
jgi:predicted O-methyltransferase YrrM